MVGIPLLRGNLGQRIVPEAPNAQCLGQVWSIDIGDLHMSIAIEVCGADGGKPPKRRANIRRVRDELEIFAELWIAVDLKPRALMDMRGNGNHLVHAVAVKIRKARLCVFKDAVWTGQDSITYHTGAIIIAHQKAAGLDRIAQDAVRIGFRCNKLAGRYDGT